MVWIAELEWMRLIWKPRWTYEQDGSSLEWIWWTRRPFGIEFGVDLVADGWFEIGGRQDGHMEVSLELV